MKIYKRDCIWFRIDTNYGSETSVNTVLWVKYRGWLKGHRIFLYFYLFLWLLKGTKHGIFSSNLFTPSHRGLKNWKTFKKFNIRSDIPCLIGKNCFIIFSISRDFFYKWFLAVLRIRIRIRIHRIHMFWASANKNSKKNLLPTALWLLFDFLSLKIMKIYLLKK